MNEQLLTLDLPQRVPKSWSAQRTLEKSSQNFRESIGVNILPL